MQPEQTFILGLAAIIGCTAAVLGVCATVLWIHVFGNAKQEAAAVFQSMIQAGSIVRMGTACIVVAAIFALGYLNRPGASEAIAALSGVAGFVLGGAQRSKKPKKPPLSESSDI